MKRMLAQPVSRMRGMLAVLVATGVFAWAGPVEAQGPPAENRIALVIGNAGYQAGTLNTPANDAGLIAQTLEAAGFDVVGARDLDQDALRRAWRDFLDKAQASGPNTVAVVYLAGYGVQLEGENYFVPVDARIARDSAVAAEAIRISDYARPLAALRLKASIIVLDAARADPFARTGPPLAGGLALVEPEPGTLIAFNAMPGTVAPEGQGAYGPYAQALAEMMREGGLPLTAVFERTRLRVNDTTRGAQVPWHASNVPAPFFFFERAPDAPQPAVSPEYTAVRARPIRQLGVQEAYVAALEQDTLPVYEEFLAVYPGDPMAARIRAIVAARREAITWRRTRAVDTPAAYWSYLRRYPRGAHAPDARRRLAFLSAELEPPRTFVVIDYDVPPPPPDEILYVERPVLMFDDPAYAFAPPPPPPVFFLPPPPAEFIVLPPPPPPMVAYALPVPVYRPVPLWVRPPAYVVPPPPNNIIYRNVHDTVVIHTNNSVTITKRGGQTTTLPPPARPAPPPGAAQQAPAALVAPAVGPALPPSVVRRTGGAPVPPAPPAPAGVRPGSPPAPGQPQPGQPLPGAGGRPLPPGAPGTPPRGAPPPGAAPPGAPPPPAPAAGAPPAQRLTPQQLRQQQLQQQQLHRQQQLQQQRQPAAPPPPPQQRAAPPPAPPQQRAAPPPPPPQQRAAPPPPPPQQRAAPPPPPPQQRAAPPPPPPQQRAAPPPPPPQQRAAPPPPPPQQRAAPPPPPPPQQRAAPPPPPPQQRAAPPPPPPPQQRAAPPPPPPQQRAAPPPPPQQQRPPPGRPPCGGPGQPACPR